MTSTPEAFLPPELAAAIDAGAIDPTNELEMLNAMGAPDVPARVPSAPAPPPLPPPPPGPPTSAPAFDLPPQLEFGPVQVPTASELRIQENRRAMREASEATARGELPESPEKYQHLLDFDQPEMNEAVRRNIASGDRVTGGGARYVPFLNLGIEPAIHGRAYHILGKWDTDVDSMSTDEWDYLAQYMLAEADAGDRGIFEQAWEMVKRMPAFMVEFGVSTPLVGAGKTAVKKGTMAGLRAGIAAAMKRIIAKQTARQGTYRFIARGSEATLGRGVGVGLQTVAMPTLWAPATAREMVEQYGFEENEAGELSLILANPDDTFTQQLVRGFANAGVEVTSERLGPVINKLGGLFGKPAQRAMQLGIVRRYLEKFPDPEAAVRVGNAIRRGGYDGILTEILEEEAGKAMRAGLGLEEYALTTLDELAAMGLAFSVPAFGPSVARTGSNLVRAGLPQEQRVREVLKELEGSIEAIGDDPIVQTPPTGAVLETNLAPRRFRAGEIRQALTQFKGARIDADRGHLRIQTPGGVDVVLLPVENLDINSIPSVREKAEATGHKQFRGVQIPMNGAALELSELGGRIEADHVIILASAANPTTLPHEVMHLATEIALTPKEKRRLYDDIAGKNSRPGEMRADEVVAEAYGFYGYQQLNHPLLRKLQDFFKKIYRTMFRSTEPGAAEIFRTLPERIAKAQKGQQAPTLDPTANFQPVRPEEAEAHRRAIEEGNVPKAAMLVDEAAERAGYSTEKDGLKEVHHGTTHKFTVFRDDRGNRENAFGVGHYFTDSEDDALSNYTSATGPDLRARIDELEQRLAEDDEFEAEYDELVESGEIDGSASFADYAAKEAERRLYGGESRHITAYLKMENPAVIAGRGQEGGTFLTWEQEFDEEGDEVGEPEGTLIDVMDEFRNVLYHETEADQSDVEEAINKVYEEAYGNGGVSLHDVYRTLQGEIIGESLYDNNGEYLSIGFVFREALERAGFDGIIDRMAGHRFPHMDGVYRDTTHYIAFHPQQIKSSDPATYDDDGNLIPLDQRFNDRNEDIRYQPVTEQQDAEYLKAVEAGDWEAARGMIERAAKDAGYDENWQHAGYFNETEGDEEFNVEPFGVHLGTEDAALQRMGGKRIDEFYSSIEVHEDTDTGKWWWEGGGFDSGDAEFDTPQDAWIDAEQAALDMGENDEGDGFYMTDAWVDVGNQLRLPDLGEWDTLDIASAMRNKGISVPHPNNTYHDLVKLIKAAGYDSVIYRNAVEDKGSDSIIIFDPSRIKSARVTRDAEGNVIPLSRRFNKQSPSVKYQGIFHGTFPDFDKFDTSFIGTGEGWAAFGWGLYFTEKRSIAKHYRDKERRKHQGDNFTVGGRAITSVADIDAGIRDADNEEDRNAFQMLRDDRDLVTIMMHRTNSPTYHLLNKIETEQKILDRAESGDVAPPFLARLPEFRERLKTRIHLMDMIGDQKSGYSTLDGRPIVWSDMRYYGELYRNGSTMAEAELGVRHNDGSPHGGADANLKQEMQSHLNGIAIGSKDWEIRRANIEQLIERLDYVEPSRGRIYEVTLAPKDDEYFLWHERFGDMPEKVQKAIIRIGYPAGVWTEDAIDYATQKYLDQRGITDARPDEREEVRKTVKGMIRGDSQSSRFDALIWAEAYKRDTGLNASEPVSQKDAASVERMIYEVRRRVFNRWRKRLDRLFNISRGGTGTPTFSRANEVRDLAEERRDDEARRAVDNLDLPAIYNAEGGDIYTEIAHHRNMSKKETSLHLLANGIRGVKYYPNSLGSGRADKLPRLRAKKDTTFGDWTESTIKAAMIAMRHEKRLRSDTTPADVADYIDWFLVNPTETHELADHPGSVDDYKAASQSLRNGDIYFSPAKFNYVIFDHDDVSIDVKFQGIPQAELDAARERVEAGVAPDPKRSLLFPTPEGQEGARIVEEARDALGRPQVLPDDVADARAEAEIANDPEGSTQKVWDKIERGEVLDSIETRIAIWRLDEIWQQAYHDEDRARAMEAAAITDALRESRAETARALRAGGLFSQDPAKRNLMFIEQALFSSNEAERRALKRINKKLKEELTTAEEKAKLLEKKQKVIERQAERVLKIKDRLKQLGLDLEDSSVDWGDIRVAAGAMRTIRQAHATLFDMMYEWWLNSILSAPVTQVRNVSGNTIFSTWEMTIQRWTEAIVNKGLPGTKEQKSRSASFGELKSMYGAFLPALSKAMQNAVLAWDTGNMVFADSVGAEVRSKIERGDRLHAIPGTFGRIVNMPTRGLAAFDDFAKTLTGNMLVQAEAYREAHAQGLKPGTRKYTVFVNQLLETPGSVAWVRAAKEADRLAFQDEGGAFVKAMINMREEIPVMRFMFPFITTPANLFRVGVKKTPLGSLRMMWKAARHGTARIGWGDQGYEYRREEVVRDLAEQMITGVATAVVLALLPYVLPDEEDGMPLITGTRPEGWGEAELSYRTAPPMSIRKPGSNEWISYSGIEPAAVTIAAIVDGLHNIHRVETTGEVQTVLDDALNSAAGQVQDKTFLRGVSDFISFFRDPARGGPRWASNFVSSWVPNVVRASLRESDNYVRQNTVFSQDDAFWTKQALRTIQKGVPSEAIAPPPKVDLWGRDISKPTGQQPATDWLFRMLSPSRLFETKDDTSGDLDRMMFIWNQRNPNNVVAPQSPKPYFKFRGENVFLTDAEYHDYAKLAGDLSLALASSIEFNFDEPTARDMGRLKKAVSAGRRRARQQMLRTMRERRDPRLFPGP